MTRHTNAGASVYEQRDNCPAPYHDSYSATRRVGCVCPEGREARRKYIKRQQFGRLEAAYIDSTGSRRRLRALAALGYPLRTLAEEIGWRGNLGRILWGDSRIHRNTAQAVADAYERLSGTPGPSQRSRDAAKRAGYVPPLAWVNIDDPDEEPSLGEVIDELPDWAVVQQALAGELRWSEIRGEADRRAVLNTFVERGITSGVACRLLHMSAEHFRDMRRRYVPQVEQAAA